MHVLMVASENDALRGGKAGGVGDVVRDVPPALVALPEFNGQVSVVVPSYGFLHEPALKRLAVIPFQFAGQDEQAELFEVEGRRPMRGVRQLVLHHPALASPDPATGKMRIYVNDTGDAPFRSDATRFALFSAAVIEGLRTGAFGTVDCLHLHDWHTGVLQILRRFDERYAGLKSLRTVFTIHNLALQGIRPVRSDTSSLEGWFPDLVCDIEQIGDPEYADCVNPMACGIRFSDAVHVVSPTYATEVCRPSEPARNDPQCFFFGGEGLEGDLRRVRDEGRLFGILNGAEYHTGHRLPVRDEASWQSLLALMHREVSGWYERTQVPRHWLALRRLTEWLESKRPRPAVVMTSVTRVVDQKVRLMQRGTQPSPLDQVLTQVGDDAVYLLTGSGTRADEEFCDEVMRRHPNMLFLHGFSIPLADALYAAGDLFLMPSAFEPCGISQMMAMRDGQPCVVHAIGGLQDTVMDGVTGFTFTGTTQEELGQAFIDGTRRAVDLCRTRRAEFDAIRQRAFETRFLWSDAVREYVRKLYSIERLGS